MKPLLAILFLLIPAACFGQGQQIAAGPFSNSGLLYVCPIPSGGTPCPSPVAIFSNITLTSGISNPIVVFAQQTYTFYAASGQYILEMPASGYQAVVGGGSGGGISVTLTCGNPTGAINGSNVTFTLPSAPAIPANLLLYHNGILQIQPTDYSISSATITEVVAPLTGESLSYCYPNNSVAWTANAGTPGGSINGANTSFTLPTAPLTPANLSLYQNGVLQKQGTDYTLAGLTITYLSAPATGGSLFYAAYN